MLEGRRLLHGGFIDPTFGNAGQVLLPASTPSAEAVEYPNAFAEPDEPGTSTSLFRFSTNAAGAAVVTKFGSHGTLDTSFGSGGSTTLQPYAGFTYAGRAVYPAPGGGYLALIVGDNGRGVAHVARLNADGTLSSTQPYTALPTAWRNIYHVTRTADGHIYAGMSTDLNGATVSGVFRLQPDGTPDTTFGSNGAASVSSSRSGITGIAPRSDGGVFVTVGYSTVVALTPAGDIDPAFDQGSITGNRAFYTFEPDDAGGFYAAGRTYAEPDFTRDSTADLYHLHADGTVEVLNDEPLLPEYSYSNAADLTRASDGSFYLALRAPRSAQTAASSYGVLMHLLPDGSRDADFGIDGRLVPQLNLPGSSGPRAAVVEDIALDASGNLLALGSAYGAAAPTATPAVLRVITASDLNPVIQTPALTVDEGTTFPLSLGFTPPAGVSITEVAWDNDSRDGVFGSQATGITFVASAGAGDRIQPAVRVTLSDGTVLYKGLLVAVRNLAPVITFAPTHPIVLRGASTNYGIGVGDADPYPSVSINFGPGTASGTAFGGVSYTYPTSGEYTAKVTVSDGVDKAQTSFPVSVLDIAVTAYLDQRFNGRLDSDDPLFGGVRIVVDLDKDGVIDDGEPSAFTGTDANARALLGQGLPNGATQLIVVPPAGYGVIGGNLQTVTVGTTGGASLSLLLHQGTEILARGFIDLDNNGAFTPPPPFSGGNVERGMQLYLDLDRDGKQDVDEPVSSTPQTGLSLQPAQFLLKLPAGEYVARLVTNTTNAGTVGLPATQPGLTFTISGTPGERVVVADTLLVPAQRNGALVVAFKDLNADGIKQSNEPEISGVFAHEDRVNLGRYDVGLESWAFSGSALRSLPAQTTVRVLTPNGYTATTPTSVTLSGLSTTNVPVVSFGFAPTGDTTGPKLVRAWIDMSERPAVVRFKFSEDVRFGEATVISSIGLPGPGSIPGTLNESVSQPMYDPETATMTLVLPPAALNANGILSFTLGPFTDVAGNINLNNKYAVVPFLRGDLDGNNRVDFADLLTLAKNYDQSGRSYVQGNLDMDPLGRVDFADLLLLAKAYGKSVLTLPQPADRAATAASASTTPTRKRVASDVL